MAFDPSMVTAIGGAIGNIFQGLGWSSVTGGNQQPTWSNPTPQQGGLTPSELLLLANSNQSNNSDNFVKYALIGLGILLILKK